MPRKQQPVRRGKTRGKPAAKTRTKTARGGKPKPSTGPKPSTARRRTARGATTTAKRAPDRLAASVAPPIDPARARLYELVCDVEGRMQGGLKLGACNELANAHLATSADHDCTCFREGTSDDAIAKRFRERARAAERARADRTR